MSKKLSQHARPLLAVAMMAMFGVAAAQTSGTGSTSGATGTTGAGATSGMSSGATGTTGRSGTDTSVGSGTHSMGSSVGPNDANSFRSLDKSNRGYLQRNDVTGISGFSFDQADSNHDGRISQDEYAQWQSSNGRAGGAMGQGSGSTSNSGMTNRQGTTGTNSGMSSGQGAMGSRSGTTK